MPINLLEVRRLRDELLILEEFLENRNQAEQAKRVLRDTIYAINAELARTERQDYPK